MGSTIKITKSKRVNEIENENNRQNRCNAQTKLKTEQVFRYCLVR